MAKFEVFIPQAGPGGMDMTLRVEAENWLAALSTGLKKLGDKSGAAANNVMVDIQDDESFHVTDPKSGRVFRIRDLTPPEAPPAPESAPKTGANPSPFDAPAPTSSADKTMTSGSPFADPGTDPGSTPFDPAVPPPNPFAPTAVAPPAQARPATAPQPQAQARPATAPPQPAAKAPPLRGTPPPVKLPATGSLTPAGGNVRSKRRPSSIADKVVELPREEAPKVTGRIGRDSSVNVVKVKVDDILADLFERTIELEAMSEPEQAMNFLLDLAMEKIDAESGSIFLADLSSNELNVCAARGPKSRELLRLNPRVGMGVGIVGYCALELVSLAISDVQRDPRFFREISERIGYQTRSVACAPMALAGRSFGCLELLNKKSSTRFEEWEIAVLSYLSEQAARYLERVG
jgi:hypothetical protein